MRKLIKWRFSERERERVTKWASVEVDLDVE